MCIRDSAKPLHKLTENKWNFQWSRECDQAFRTSKIALCSQPILAFPDSEGKYIVDTDASNTGLGAVLSQVQNGEERVIAYYSKTLSKPERNYCVTRRELLAIVRALEHFHKYLYGREFSLRTDHAAIAWLLRFKNLVGQLVRLLECLQEYNFKVQHRRGRLHGNADGLSRRPCPEDCRHCHRKKEQNGSKHVQAITCLLYTSLHHGNTHNSF